MLRRTALAAGLAVTVAVGACTSGDTGDAITKGKPDSDVVTGNDKSTTTTERSTTTTGPRSTTTTTTEAARQDLVVAEYGYASYRPEYADADRTSWAVLLKNPNPNGWLATDINVNVTFKNAAGQVIKTESDTVAVILPGQTAAVTPLGSSDVAGVAAMEVQARVGEWEEDDRAAWPTLTVDGITTVTREYGGLQTNGTVHSTYDADLENTMAAVVYRDAGGKIVGGDATFIDFIPAGGEIGVEVTSSDDIPGRASSEIHVALTSLSLSGLDDE